MKLRRRTYITNAGLQMKVTLVFIAISLIGSIVSTFVFNFFALKKLEALMWSTHIRVDNTVELLRPLFMYVNAANFVFVALLLVFAIMWMMRIKSGPIYRMNRDIKSIADGDLTVNISLRKKDEFQDVADELNNMTEMLGQRFYSVVKSYSAVSGALQQLNGDSDPDEAVEKECETVLDRINKAEEELAWFRV